MKKGKTFGQQVLMSYLPEETSNHFSSYYFPGEFP